MSTEITFEQDGSGVVIKISGTLTGKDIISGTATIYADERASSLKYQILDLSDVENIDITLDHLEQAAKMDKTGSELSQGMAIAMVVRSPLLQALCETWINYAKNDFLHTQLCKSLAEARHWALSITAPQANSETV